MKKVLGVQSAPRGHWVGDGFPVRSLFSYQTHARELSPFLMLDYAAPTEFAPRLPPRGVGAHPHRGFETVTIVYQGEVEHRDSTGGGGVIGPGDVQWMTAAAGIMHNEFHSQAFARQGGTMEMVQLWVNLPARDKSAPAGYQSITHAQIPQVELSREAGKLRVIAGEFSGHRGPAHTFTPIEVWDMRLNAGARTRLELPAGHTVAVVVLHGAVEANGQRAGAAQMVVLDRAGTTVELATEAPATVLVLAGEPIDEPVVGHGPFVMNTAAEIQQAIDDFNAGRFGRVVA